MNDTTNVRIITVIIISLGLYYLYYLYKYRHKSEIIIYRRMFISVIALNIASMSAIPRPPIFWFHLLGILCLHQGSIFIYFAIKQIFTKSITLNIYKTKLYLYSLMISISSIVFDYIRYTQNNFGSFLDNDIFNKTLSFYLSYYTNYGLLFFLMTLMSWTYLNEIKKHPRVEISYRIRRFVSFIGFTMASITMFFVIINLTIHIFGVDHYQDFINHYYQIFRQTFVLLLIISPLFPQILLRLLITPYTFLQSLKSRTEENYIITLHQTIGKITPGIILNDPHIVSQRRLIEIMDGRDLILSHEEHQPQTASEEASILLKYQTSQTVINNVGAYEPTSPHYGIIEVAKCLQGTSGLS